MKVFSVLVSIFTTVSTQQQGMYIYAIYRHAHIHGFKLTKWLTECLNGQVQTISNSLEYCYHGEWRWTCRDDSQWNHEMTISVCTQLGYNDSGGKLVIK